VQSRSVVVGVQFRAARRSMSGRGRSVRARWSRSGTNRSYPTASCGSVALLARRDALLCLPRAASFMTNVQCPPDDARPRPYYHIAVHFYRFFCHRRIDGIVPMKGTEQQLVSAWNGLPTAPPAPRRPVTKTHSNRN